MSCTGQSEGGTTGLFDQLTLLVHRLHETWVAYVELFGKDRARVAEMNRRAGFAFELIRLAMLDWIILGIAKTLDGDSRTVSLRRAIAELPDAPPGATKEGRKELADRKSDFVRRYDQLRRICESILAHRDKRIAHDQRTVVMGHEALPSVTFNEMESAMAGIAELCDELSRARTGETGLSFIGAEMDVEPSCRALCYVLRAGNYFLDQQWAERDKLLARAARGEVVENIEAKLKAYRKWFE